jgi:hypothetical protein
MESFPVYQGIEVGLRQLQQLPRCTQVRRLDQNKYRPIYQRDAIGSDSDQIGRELSKEACFPP